MKEVEGGGVEGVREGEKDIYIQTNQVLKIASNTLKQI
jgi:hypothetical protein